MRQIAVVLGAVVTASTILGQKETVGGIADTIEVRGCESVDPDDVALALRSHPDWIVRSESGADRAALLEFAATQVRAGFRDYGWANAKVEARVAKGGDRLVIDVAEGALVVLDRIEVRGCEYLDAETVRNAIARPDAEPGAFGWRVGARGRFGPRGLALAWQAVERVYRDRALPPPEGRVDIRWLEGDRAILDVLIEKDHEPTPLRVDFIGEFSDEPRLIFERIGWVPGTRIAPDDLRRRVLALGRYSGVDVEVATSDRFVVRVTQLANAPSWTDMPWEETALFQRAARSLVDELHSGDRGMRVVVEFGEQPVASIERFVVAASADAAWLELAGWQDDAGEPRTVCLTSCDGALSLAIDDTVAELALGSQFGAVVRMALRPETSGRFEFDWGFGLASNSRGVQASIHDATFTALRAREDVAWTPTSDGYELRTDIGTFRVDAATEKLGVHVAGDAIRFELVESSLADRVRRHREAAAERVEFGEILARLVPMLGVDDGASVDLLRIAAGELRARRFFEGDSTFEIRTVAADPNSIPRRILRGLESMFAPRTWPWALTRYAAGALAATTDRERAIVSAQLREIGLQDDGPLAMLSYAAVYRLVGPATRTDPATLASLGKQRLTFDAFWHDVQTLAAGGREIRVYLDDVAEAWRAVDLGLADDAESTDVLRFGMQHLWDTVLHDALFTALDALARR